MVLIERHSIGAILVYHMTLHNQPPSWLSHDSSQPVAILVYHVVFHNQPPSCLTTLLLMTCRHLGDPVTL